MRGAHSLVQQLVKTLGVREVGMFSGVRALQLTCDLQMRGRWGDELWFLGAAEGLFGVLSFCFQYEFLAYWLMKVKLLFNERRKTIVTRGA